MSSNSRLKAIQIIYQRKALWIQFSWRQSQLSNADNVRAPIRFRRERQYQHLKGSFLPKNIPIHFHINSPGIRQLKPHKLSFPTIEINKPLPTLVYSFSISDSSSESNSAIAIYQIPDHTSSREQYNYRQQNYR